jgi:hypothetical protein
MKLDKKVVQRRVDLMAAEGVHFITNAHVGTTVDAAQIKADHEAVIVATGATWPRDLKLPNREADGIHFAMDYLQPNTKSLLDSDLSDEKFISAKGKDVVVIGGGDTGNDCIGTAVRHGANSVVNFELLPAPPSQRAPENPWPQFARVKKTDYGHAEVSSEYGGKDPREYCISTKQFVVDDEGKLKGLATIRVEWTNNSGKWSMEEVKGSEEVSPSSSSALLPSLTALVHLVLPLSARPPRLGFPRTSEGVHQRAGREMRSPYQRPNPQRQILDERFRRLRGRRLSTRPIPCGLGDQGGSPGGRGGRCLPRWQHPPRLPGWDPEAVMAASADHQVDPRDE